MEVYQCHSKVYLAHSAQAGNYQQILSLWLWCWKAPLLLVGRASSGIPRTNRINSSMYIGFSSRGSS